MKIKEYELETLSVSDKDVSPLMEEVGESMVHNLYLLDNYQKNKVRVSCASTRNRRLMNGGGAKPYKQKGTGRARRGSSRSPLMVGGAVIFGPVPHSYETDLNNEMISKVLRQAITSVSPKSVCVKLPKSDKLKTKQVEKMLVALGRKRGDKVLVVLTEADLAFERAVRNIENVDLCSPAFLPVGKLACSKHIIFSELAMNQLIKRFEK